VRAHVRRQERRQADRQGQAGGQAFQHVLHKSSSPGSSGGRALGDNVESMIRSALVSLLLSTAIHAQPNAPKPDPLWPNGPPARQGMEDIDRPTLTPYLMPAGRGVGTAVIVCPGGGYQNLSMDKEGSQIAQFLNSIGVTAFVLKYRLGPKYHHPIELG